MTTLGVNVTLAVGEVLRARAKNKLLLPTHNYTGCGETVEKRETLINTRQTIATNYKGRCARRKIIQNLIGRRRPAPQAPALQSRPRNWALGTHQRTERRKQQTENFHHRSPINQTATQTPQFRGFLHIAPANPPLQERRGQTDPRYSTPPHETPDYPATHTCQLHPPYPTQPTG